MPCRPNKKASKRNPKRKLKHNFSTVPIHHSPSAIQPQVQESIIEAKLCYGKELSGCEETASFHRYLAAKEEEEKEKVSSDHTEMADSSNGKLEDTKKVQEDEVVDDAPVAASVRDVVIDDYSLEDAKKPAETIDEKTPQVVESEEVVLEGKKEEGSVSVVETETSKDSYVVDDMKPEVKEEEKVEVQYLPSVEYVVPEHIGEEKTLPELVSNGVEKAEVLTLSEGITEHMTNMVSRAIEETEVPCADKEEEEVVPPVVADEVSRGIEEVKLPVAEEISTGESSGTAYKESVDEAPLKPEVVTVPPPVESSNVEEGYEKPEIREREAKPSFVSVTRAHLNPTSWKSCCGLFQVLRRSDNDNSRD